MPEYRLDRAKASPRGGRRTRQTENAASVDPGLAAILAVQTTAGNAATQKLMRAPAKPKPPLYSAEEAQAVAERWQKEGTLETTDTKEDIETAAYFRWRRRLRAVVDKAMLDAVHGTGKTLQFEGLVEPISVIEHDFAEWGLWLQAFEARERFVLRNPGGADATGSPPDPGPTPASLAAAKDLQGKELGSPPRPAFRIVRKHVISVPGRAEQITYPEAVRKGGVSPGYEYLTNETGVGRKGTALKDRLDMDELFAAAGITEAGQRKALLKVTAQEGGFEAVNTYDTGFISVGAIQFISGKEGTGALLDLLRATKRDDAGAGEFGTYFRDLGIDVDQQGLGVVDPASGAVLRGEDAVRKIIADPRLTAVFQHAGERWRTYQVAQLKEAIRSYWLADETFHVEYSAGKRKPKLTIPIDGRISDVLRSEAGRTALMDTAVQKGAGRARKNFREGCAAVAKKHLATSADELAEYEREIIPYIQNRIEVLKDKDLTQAPPVPLPVKPLGPGDFPEAAGASVRPA